LCVPATHAVTRPRPPRARASGRRRSSPPAARPIVPAVNPAVVDANGADPGAGVPIQ
jgi:hypothetical protein